MSLKSINLNKMISWLLFCHESHVTWFSWDCFCGICFSFGLFHLKGCLFVNLTKTKYSYSVKMEMYPHFCNLVLILLLWLYARWYYIALSQELWLLFFIKFIFNLHLHLIILPCKYATIPKPRLTLTYTSMKCIL